MTSLLWIYHNLGLETFWQRRFLRWYKVLMLLQGKTENFTRTTNGEYWLSSWQLRKWGRAGHKSQYYPAPANQNTPLTWISTRKNIVEDLKLNMLNTCPTFLLNILRSIRYATCKFVREKLFNVTWMAVEPCHIATPPNSEPDGKGEPNDLMNLHRILEVDFPLNLKFPNLHLHWLSQLRKMRLNSEWVYAMSSSKSRPIRTFWTRHPQPPTGRKEANASQRPESWCPKAKLNLRLHVEIVALKKWIDHKQTTYSNVLCETFQRCFSFKGWSSAQFWVSSLSMWDP